MRKRTSVIWSIPKDEFIKLVAQSTSHRQILQYFGMDNKGGNGRTLKRRIAEEGIDDSHIRNRNKTLNANIAQSIPYEKIFIENSLVSRSVAKDRIIKENLLDHTHCSKCHRENMWENEPLVMILDHINGISNDHRLENLRFVCPNCNSQLPTFAGRQHKVDIICLQCGKTKQTKQSEVCNSCSKKNRQKVERPPQEQLISEIDEIGYLATGRKYGVSDNAIRKWIK